MALRTVQPVSLYVCIVRQSVSNIALCGVRMIEAYGGCSWAIGPHLILLKLHQKHEAFVRCFPSSPSSMSLLWM